MKTFILYFSGVEGNIAIKEYLLKTHTSLGKHNFIISYKLSNEKCRTLEEEIFQV